MYLVVMSAWCLPGALFSSAWPRGVT